MGEQKKVTIIHYANSPYLYNKEASEKVDLITVFWEKTFKCGNGIEEYNSYFQTKT